jgi:prophage antirepressor-like protein
MKDLREFCFEEKNIRAIEIDGQPWFLAKDVCNALNHSDVSVALSRLEDDEKLTQTMFVSGQNRKVLLVNESGLYALIFTSRLEKAREFRKWVTSVVLPQIRKTGKFEIPETVGHVTREKSKQIRNNFTDTLKAHGINKPVEYAVITNSQKDHLGIKRKPKSQFNQNELDAVAMSEILSAFRLRNSRVSGVTKVKPITDDSAMIVHEHTIGALESRENLIKQLS